VRGKDIKKKAGSTWIEEEYYLLWQQLTISPTKQNHGSHQKSASSPLR